MQYTYSAWGRYLTCTGELATSLGYYNPLRYRGYVYDQELGLYYLQSRYYNPGLCRFNAPDAFASTGQGLLGNNMFAYCNNNPIVSSDPSGQVPIGNFAIDISGTGGKLKEDDIPQSIFAVTNGIINGQAVFPYAGERMGWGTYAKNACGIIAVYNAMQLLGYKESLGLVEAEISNAGGLCLVGLFGVKCQAIGNYLTAHNIPYTGYRSYSTMIQSLSDGDIIIFEVINNRLNILKGYHYMTAQYLGGEFIVYNHSSYQTSSLTVSTLDPVYGNSSWHYGFVIGG